MTKDPCKCGKAILIIAAAVVACTLWWKGVRDIKMIDKDSDRDRHLIIRQLIENTRITKALLFAAGIDSALIETPMLDSLLLDDAPEDSSGSSP